MKNLLSTHTVLSSVIIINFFVIVVGMIAYSLLPEYDFPILLFLLQPLNILSLVFVIKPFKKPLNKNRVVFGRKRIIVTLFCIGSIILCSLFTIELISSVTFLLTFSGWTILLLCLQKFYYETTALLQKIAGHQHCIGIIGNNEKSLQMANHLRHKKRFSLVKHFSANELTLDNKNNERQTSLYSFTDFAKEKGVKELYVSSASEYLSDETAFFQEANKHCIRINFIEVEPSPEFSPYHIKYLYGMPVWQRYNEPLRRTINHVIKRTIDFIISALVILFILSWLIPLVGLLIKLESKGPVFFKQLRSGRNNSSFICLKFRSMAVNKESDSKQASIKDSRITRIGAFLRKTSLDEFPQFINVLRGEMSVVGPRPHMLRHTEEYSKLIKPYMSRLYLKPGITGWAQINGYRGETVNVMLMEKRVEYDIEYMENWSLRLDFTIMISTFWSIVTGDENAF